MKSVPRTSLLLIPLVFLAFSGRGTAQDNKPTPAEEPAQTVSNSAITALDNQIDDLNEEIVRLDDAKADTDLEFRHLQRVDLEELMSDKADAAEKAGDPKGAEAVRQKIKALDDARDSEWNQDQVLLEKRSQLEQLKWDRVLELNKQLTEKAKELGSEKRLKELEEGQNYVAQMKDLENQLLGLRKSLYQARWKYDYKTADEIRAQLKVLRAKSKETSKKVTEKLKEIERTQELEEQNL